MADLLRRVRLFALCAYKYYMEGFATPFYFFREKCFSFIFSAFKALENGALVLLAVDYLLGSNDDVALIV